MKKVIIVGCDHTNTLGLIRCFGEGGIRPNLVMDCNPDDNMSSHSKYLDKVVYVKDYENLDEVLHREFPEGGVLITMSDKSAEYLDRFYDQLSSKFILPSFRGEGGHFKENISKETQRLAAEQCGILTPASWTVDWVGGDCKLPEDIIYPCIIKAIDSEAGPKDINIFNTEAELIAGLNDLASKCSDTRIQIQEFLKKDKEVVFIGYASGKDDICIPCMLEKGLEYPEGFGWYLFGTLTPDVNKYLDEKDLKRLIASFDYSGPFSADFLWANGKAYMCEINFRNDGNGYYPTPAGVNIPVLWYEAVTGQGKPNRNLKIRKEYTIMREQISLIWARETKNFGRMIKEFFKADFREIWNKKDPKPFFYTAKRFLKKKI